MGICYSNTSKCKSDHQVSILPPTDLKSFTFTDLQKATQNFKVKAGRGLPKGVYKGWINTESFKAASRPGVGVLVSVEKVSQERLQDQLDAVNFVGNLSHPNIVGLIGYCTEGNNMFLVYEYMARGNLENHLFRTNKCRLSWSLRFKIILGVAKAGLAFLHSAQVGLAGRVDKFSPPSGIFLDSDHNPKIHGFRRHNNDKVLDIDMYTRECNSYAGPLTQDVDPRSIPHYDVYSYGVVLLEVLLGRRLTYQEQDQIPHKCHQLDQLMDKGLKGKYPLDTARAMAKLAIRCQSKDLRSRPSMAEVVVELEALQSNDSS